MIPQQVTRLKLMNSLSFLLLLLIPWQALAQKSPPKTPAPQNRAKVTTLAKTTPALWRVTTAGKGYKPVYLFGSIHIGNKAMFPMPDYLLNPFRESRYLAVELDTSKVTPKIQKTIRSYTLLPKGESLKDWLSKSTYTQLMDYARRHKMTGFEPKQPWFVASQVSLDRAGSLGFSPQYGVDVYFIGEAKARNIPLLAIEDWEDQLGVFGKMSKKEQGRYLAETIKSHRVARDSDPTLKLMWAWQNGHSEDLWQQVSQEMARIDDPKFLQRMLYDRNDIMVKAVQPWLRLPYSTFVIVGSAHLLGPKGLLHQLYRKGHTIERINPRTKTWYDAFPRGKSEKRVHAANR